MKIRRVVTGHDDNGKAIVVVDEETTNVRNTRPGVETTVIWTTESFPVSNSGYKDESAEQALTTRDNGTVFRVISFAAGNAGRMHRTNSIDYLVVVSGSIDMEMDDTVVHLEAGDVMVQRGTIHNWVNNGSEPCVIAFVLIDAAPAQAGGKTLEPIG
jgi:mannose-6-phosphate isomerase-like protein (cupin superfamily)